MRILAQDGRTGVGLTPSVQGDSASAVLSLCALSFWPFGREPQTDACLLKSHKWNRLRTQFARRQCGLKVDVEVLGLAV